MPTFAPFAFSLIYRSGQVYTDIIILCVCLQGEELGSGKGRSVHLR